ncbi:CHAT domain-containing protein [Suillus cothurnatus]|nr:CHAT domain-containing protein [Suillus cothurnatus]
MLHREALSLLQVGHPDRSFNAQDSDEAIMLYREALSLCPVGHSGRPLSLNNLATQLSTRFKYQQNPEDLDKAITLHTEALALQPVGHPSLNNLGNALSFRFEHGGNDQDLDEAIKLCRENTVFVPSWSPSSVHGIIYFAGALIVRFKHGHNGEDLNNALENLRCALTLSVQYDPRQLRVHQRLADIYLLFHQSGLDGTGEDPDNMNAAMHHIKAAANAVSGGPSQMACWTPICLPQLQSHLVHDAMKTFPRTLAVDAASCALRSGDDSYLDPGNTIPYTYRQPSQGVAITKRPSEKISRPQFTPNRPPMPLVAGLSSFSLQASRIAMQSSSHIRSLRLISLELWVEVVHPVVERSRIWWCPTSLFNFMPLHAAGEYSRGGKSLAQLYIYSYAPSLTALIKARRRRDQPLSLSFAAIGQNRPEGYSTILECVEPELTLVTFTKITSIDATQSRALSALRDNPWLHFACHGTQNHIEPFKSALLMRDKPLSLLDITQIDLSSHAFAFLSACETAVGNFDTPDEVIHLAAALQFAGVNSVVGTLWSVSDSTVQRLVEEFYKNFCGDDTMNSKRAARALHRAVQSLANDKDIPLDQRIVFIHIGI